MVPLSCRSMARYSSTRHSASAVAPPSTKIVVTRALSEWGSSSRRPLGIRIEPVADAPHGPDGTSPERPVDLVAQVADVDVDHVGRTAIREVPDVIDQVGAAEHLAGPAHQLL